MSAEHTPGPWQFAEAGSWKDGVRTSKEYFVRRPDDDVAIASEILNPEDSTPSEANARLIAAAPELLAALEVCVDELKRNGIQSESIQDARAAIAKAKGGQP